MASDTSNNFVFDSFNLDDPSLEGWDGQGGGPPEIAPGEYAFEVVSCEVVDTNAGDGKNFKVEYKVISDGDAFGKTLLQWYLFAGDKVKGGHRRRIAHVFRDALRVKRNAGGGFETKDVVGCRMYAVVAHEEYTKYDPQSQVHKEHINAALSCERPIEDEATAAAAAPPKAPPAPAKAASAPVSRPPAAPPPRAPATAPRAR